MSARWKARSMECAPFGLGLFVVLFALFGAESPSADAAEIWSIDREPNPQQLVHFDSSAPGVITVALARSNSWKA